LRLYYVWRNYTMKNTLTGKLYTGIVAVALAAMPSVAYGHNAAVKDDLGRIVSQTCGDGEGLHMEARVLYNGNERVPIGVVADNFAQQRKETVMYNSTNGQRAVTIEDMVTPTVVGIEDMVTPTTAGDFIDRVECKPGKPYCTFNGYLKLPKGFVENEASKPVQTFTCQKGKKTCVSGAGYRVSLTYVHDKAIQAFTLLNIALIHKKLNSLE